MYSRKKISLNKFRKAISSIFLLVFLFSNFSLFAETALAEELASDTASSEVVASTETKSEEVTVPTEVVTPFEDLSTEVLDAALSHSDEENLPEVTGPEEVVGPREGDLVATSTDPLATTTEPSEIIATTTEAVASSTPEEIIELPTTTATTTEIVATSTEPIATSTDSIIEEIATSTDPIIEEIKEIELPLLDFENDLVGLTLPEDISKEILLRSSTDLESLPLRLSISRTTATSTPVLRNDYVVYSDVFLNTDVEYKITESGLKENIILKEKEHPAEFVYSINFENYDYVLVDNVLNLYKKGKKGNDLFLLYKISAPYMSDSEGNRSERIGLSVVGDELVVTPDSTWLSTAVYPVVVDPTVEVSVLNLHSHPVVGEQWNVDFTTVGTGDLKITPADQATIDDDQFTSLFCGTEDRTASTTILEGDVLFYPDWSCDDVATVSHLTLVTGNHHLLFEFSGAGQMASSEAFNANRTWDGGGADALWSNDLNWSSDTEPGTNDVAVFDGTCVSNCSPTIDTAISVSGISMNSGYAGTITQGSGNAITIGGSGFVKAAGTFTGSNASITINGSFSQSAGTFTSTSGTISVINNFTLTSGTFNHNSGTVLIADTSVIQDSTISCSGAPFNVVVITKNDGFAGYNAVTIGSGCTVPLGASPTTTMSGGGTLTNNGTITIASGTWTYSGFSNLANNGTITHSGNGWVSGGALTMGASAVVTYSGTTATFNGDLNVASGTFPTGLDITIADNGVIQNSTISCSGNAFNKVTITKNDGFAGYNTVTISAGCTVALGASPTTTLTGGAALTNNGTITVASGTWTYNGGNLTNNGTITHSGNGWTSIAGLTMGASGVVTYAGTDASFMGSLNLTLGTFPSGKNIAFTDNASDGDTTLSCGSVTFGTITITKDSGGDMIISSGCTVPLGASPTTFITEATFTNNGTITIDSGTWTQNGTASGGVNLTNNGTITHNGSGWLSHGGLIMGSSGVVTYSGSTLSFARTFNVGSGTFPSGKTITFFDDGTDSDTTLTCGSVTFAGVTITKDSGGDMIISSGCTVPLGANPTTFVTESTFTNNGTITIASGTWTQNGTASGGVNLTNNGTINHSGSDWFSHGGLIMGSSGVVTYSGTTMSFARTFNVGSGTFPSGKTITFFDDGTDSDTTFTSGSVTFAGITITKDSGGDMVIGSSFTDTGDFSFTAGTISNPASSYTGIIQGNFSQTAATAFGGANLNLSFQGTATSTLSRTTGSIQSPITINKTGAGGVALGSAFFASSTVTLQAGLFDASTYANTTAGLFTISGGRYLANSGTQTFNSGLTVSGGTYTGGSGTTDINGALTLSSGTVNPAGTMTISGNLVHTSGTFSASSGTVNFDGTSQSISGNNTFYNLTKSVASAATLTIDAASTNTVTNTLALSGAASNLLSLRSSSNGSQWNIDPQGTRTLSYLDVKDSNNTNATFINAVGSNSTDSGNNTNWFLSAPTITQGSYRFYENIDQIQPTTALAAQNATTTLYATSSPVRLRMNIAPTVGSVPVGYLQTKLQVATSSGGIWKDVNSGVGDVWFNDSWQSRKKITLNNSASSENLTNFPILVALNSSTVDYSKTQNSGQDIRFVDPDGTQLNYEIELWNESATSTVWIKVPQIDALSTTDYIWMYYNNSSATDAQSASGVWDSNFKSVLHLKETSGTSVVDSTSNANSGTKAGTTDPTATTSGKINGAQYFDGSNDYISMPSSYTNAVANFTIGMWIKTTENGSNGTYWNRPSLYGNSAPSSPDSDFGITTNGGLLGMWSGLYSGGDNSVISSSSINDDTWHYVTLIASSTGMLLYLDGATTTAYLQKNQSLNNYGYWIGAQHYYSGGANFYHRGTFDEFRFSNTARTQNWIVAEYRNMNGLMNTFGSEESLSSEWFYYDNASVTSSTTISSNLLSNSNVRATYQEGRPSALNPLAASNGEYLEYDWVIKPTGVASNSNYLFRMVNSDGTAFSAYTNYAALTYTANSFGTVSNLGPTVYINGSWGNQNTPSLTFTTADPDIADTVSYQLQISTTSNFAGIVVDYTSALATPGAKSFTVGQAAGTGTYAVGSVSQTLSDGDYYWRVRVTDSVGQVSSYSTANSGSIAFKVDTALTSAGSLSLTTSATSIITTTISGASDGGNGLAATPYIFYNTTRGTNSLATSSTSWIETGLSVNTSYTYLASVMDGLGNTATTSSASLYTRANAPTSPSASLTGTGEITLSWSANSNPGGTEYYPVNTTASTSPGWVTTTSSVFSGLSCGTTYSFVVRARNGDGVITSNTATTSQITQDCNATPSTPTTLAPTAYVNGSWGTDNTPTLTFTQSDSDGADTLRYHIQIDNNSDFSSPTVESFSSFLAQGGTSFTSTTLPDGQYYWRVRSFDGTATSSYATANGGAIAFGIDTTNPTAGSLTLGSVTATTITATQAGASDASSGLSTTPYIIYNTTASTNSLATSSLIWTSSSLTPNTSYTFYTAVSDLVGNSATTSNASAYTLANPPLTPSASADSSTQITFSWGANSNAAGTEYYATNLTASTTSGWITTTSTAFSGLSCATSYSFEVKARNANGIETATTTAVSASTSSCVTPPGNGNSGGGNGAPGGGVGGGIGNPPRAVGQGFSVVINNDDVLTNSATVNLKFSGGPDAVKMLVSNTPDFTGAQLQDYDKSISWNICTGVCANGVYGVYVKFYTFWGAASPAVYDTIEYSNPGSVYVPPQTNQNTPLILGLGASLDKKTWFAPLLGVSTADKVSLKADVSLVSLGKDKIKYEFDCTSDGIIDHTLPNSNQTSVSANNTCRYQIPGIYVATVKATRAGAVYSKTVLVTVGNPAPTPVVPPVVVPPVTPPVVPPTPPVVPPTPITPVVPPGTPVVTPPVVTNPEVPPVVPEVVATPPGPTIIEQIVTVITETTTTVVSEIAEIVNNIPPFVASLPEIFGGAGESAIQRITDAGVELGASFVENSSSAVTFVAGTASEVISVKTAEKVVTAIKSADTITGVALTSLAPIMLTAEYSVAAANTLAGVKSLTDLIYLMIGLFNGLMTSLGLRKRRRHWGVVYDALTKQPLDPVLVQLVDATTGKVVEESITDMFGRFGFIDRPGIYKINVQKTNYRFPSQQMSGVSDVLFANVYFGEEFAIHFAGEVIAPNIPMDQMSSDWNQLEKQKMGFWSTHMRLDTIIVKTLQALFYGGLITMSLFYLVKPTVINGMLALAYILLGALNQYLPRPKLWGKISSLGLNTESLLVELHHPAVPEVVVAKTMTKADGKFLLRVQPGEYILKVKSIGDSDVTLIKEEKVIVGSNGAVDKNIVLD